MRPPSARHASARSRQPRAGLAPGRRASSSAARRCRDVVRARCASRRSCRRAGARPGSGRPCPLPFSNTRSTPCGDCRASTSGSLKRSLPEDHRVQVRVVGALHVVHRDLHLHAEEARARPRCAGRSISRASTGYLPRRPSRSASIGTKSKSPLPSFSPRSRARPRAPAPFLRSSLGFQVVRMPLNHSGSEQDERRRSAGAGRCRGPSSAAADEGAGRQRAEQRDQRRGSRSGSRCPTASTSQRSPRFSSSVDRARASRPRPAPRRPRAAASRRRAPSSACAPRRGGAR